MQWLAVCVLATTIYSGGGVTKTSGLEQFWTDDYKIFEQVYGKTSDKEIYGVALPPSGSFAEPKHQASDKKERYLTNYNKEEDIDTYTYGDNYNFLTKPVMKEKPATSSVNFVSYNNFKPISQNSDPETYNYLKNLEQIERERNSALVGGFKPYLSYSGPNAEEIDAHKSIQDILDAHEANKGKDEDDGSKYLTYRGKSNMKVNTKKPLRKVNEVLKPKCLPGRCRKTSSISLPTYRVRSKSRPYYKIIKHRIY